MIINWSKIQRHRFFMSLSHAITTPTVAVPFFVVATTLSLFLMNASLLKSGIYPTQWYDVSFALVCLFPAAVGHVFMYISKHRSPYVWLLWIPGILFFWARPWFNADGWMILGMRPDYIWDQIRVLFWAVFYDQSLPPGAVSTVLSVFLMGAAMTAVICRPFIVPRSDGTAVSRSPKGAGTVEGLPQARWADAREISENFHHPGGIVLGELTDPIDSTPHFDPQHRKTWKRQGKGALITMNPDRGNGHVLVITASAGGKTAGIVIPNILHYKGPLVVVDPKGDLYARTKHTRQKMGYKPRVINATHGFDPFKLIAPLATSTPSIYLTMAKTLMPLSSRSSDISEYFHDMSCSLFAALMAHFINRGSHNVARDISQFISQPREAVLQRADHIADNSDLPLIRDELRGLAALDERTYPGVVKGIANKLAFVKFPDVACYGYSTLTPQQHLKMLRPKTDIFINLPTLAAKDFSSFLRLLIGAMYVATELLERPDRPKARRLFLIDEARVLGGMDALTNVRDAGRSIGMHLMLIYQSLGQLKDAWGGDAGADAWLDSCEARIVGAVGSARTAQDLVTMLGRRTMSTRTRSSSSSSHVMNILGGSVSSSAQEQLRDVPLMSAEALGRLPAHGSLIFTRRTRPILATKAFYFTRDDMTKKVKSPDDVVKKLEVTKRRKAVKDGLKEKPKSTTTSQDNTRQDVPSADEQQEQNISEQRPSPEAVMTSNEREMENSEAAASTDTRQESETSSRSPDYADTIVAAPESDHMNRNDNSQNNPIVNIDRHQLAAMNALADQHPEVFDMAHRHPQFFRMDADQRVVFEAVVADRYHDMEKQNPSNITGKLDDNHPTDACDPHLTDVDESLTTDRAHIDDNTVADSTASAALDTPTVLEECQNGTKAAEPCVQHNEHQNALETETRDDQGSTDNDEHERDLDTTACLAQKLTPSVITPLTQKHQKASAKSPQSPSINADQIRIMLQFKRENLFERVFGPPHNRHSSNWRAAADDAISFAHTGLNQGQWHHHKLGAGGDLFDLVAIAFCGRPIEQKSAPRDFPQILKAAAEYVGYHQTGAHVPSTAAMKSQQAEHEKQRHQDMQDKRALVNILQSHALPIDDTPASTYLKKRGLLSWPKQGLSYLPPLNGCLPTLMNQTILGSKFNALTIWAEDNDGTIIGGQRILLTSRGDKVDIKHNKPNFGFISSAAGKFRARTNTKESPIVIAEGPESALSVWFAMGVETWTVFGVSGFQSISLPPDRRIILAPDQDPSDSQAAIGFRKAVNHHLKNNSDLWLAVAPEPIGSKNDLNDTLQHQGVDAVCAAIASARPFTESDFCHDT